MNYKNKTIDELISLAQDYRKDASLLRYLGERLLEARRLEEAERCFRKALGILGDDADCKLDLARVFIELEKYPAASIILEDLLAQKQYPARTHLVYAYLLLRTDELLAAQEEYDIATSLDNNLADLHFEAELYQLDIEEIETGIVAEKHTEKFIEEEKEEAKNYITFSDVGGMDEVKEQINFKIIMPTKRADIYKAYGIKTGGGILLYGPPGCGKTYLAKATAGEVQAHFMSVGIHDILDMWRGSSEKNLHEVFHTARSRKPCVLFFDEVDALGASRSDMKKHDSRHLINQFLSELDGIDADNEGVFNFSSYEYTLAFGPCFSSSWAF